MDVRWEVIRRIRLGPAHTPTGRTRHYFGRELLPTPTTLKICVAREGERASYYLLYFDESGRELTDTFHESLDAAFRQAEFEFRTLPDEWEHVSEPYPS